MTEFCLSDKLAGNQFRELKAELGDDTQNMDTIDFCKKCKCMTNFINNKCDLCNDLERAYFKGEAKSSALSLGIQVAQNERKKIIEIIDKKIRMWESDNKGKERYYGTSGCIVKVLEELKAELGGKDD